MDVREKLVEQLREVASKTPPICRYDNPDEIEHFGKTITVYCKPFEQFQELMRDAADYIAHSVTVQEWISVKDRLPEKHDRFICTYKFNSNSEMQFVGVLEYYASDQYPHWQHESAGVIVTNWMSLPEPPKGE